VSVCNPEGPHSLHVYHVLCTICLGISPERVLKIVVLVQRSNKYRQLDALQHCDNTRATKLKQNFTDSRSQC